MQQVLRGRKGVVPEGAVYIGDRARYPPWQHLRRSKWYNPYKIGRDGTREEVIIKYKRRLYDSGLINDIYELRGRDLGCWCAPEPCQATCCCGWRTGETQVRTQRGQWWLPR